MAQPAKGVALELACRHYTPMPLPSQVSYSSVLQTSVADSTLISVGLPTMNEREHMDTTENVVAVIPLDDNREIRVSVIQTAELDFVRIAPFVDDQAMSGAIFPRKALVDVIAGLHKAVPTLGRKK
jgi:hypothetical protein